MTLILSLVTRGHAFQVSDRLLTRAHGQKITAFDPLSNKSLVFRARDGLVLIGYCGRAYIDHRPTDAWIAQSLAGVELPAKFMARGLEQGAKWLDIGPAVRRLRGDLEKAFAVLRPCVLADNPIQISIVGSRVASNPIGTEPVACELVQLRGTSRVELRWKRAHWNWMRGYTVYVEPDQHMPAIARMRDELRSRGGESPEICESILVDALRERSLTDHAVGDDCLSVRFGLDWQPVIRFIPAPGAREHALDGQPCAYSPWIIAPPGIMAPSLTNGGWSTSNLSWTVVGLPEQTFPRKAFQSAQTRPDDSQR